MRDDGTCRNYFPSERIQAYQPQELCNPRGQAPWVIPPEAGKKAGAIRSNPGQAPWVIPPETEKKAGAAGITRGACPHGLQNYDRRLEYMKKNTSLLLMFLLAVSLLSACGKNAAAPADTAQTTAAAAQAADGETAETADLVTIKVNIKDLGGNIAVTDDGSDPAPDPDYPMQSASSNVAKGTVVKILAEPEEGYHFFKWTVDGAEYSTEPMITVTAEEDTEFIAEFLPEGKDGNPVALDAVTTLGELLGLPEVGTSFTDTALVYAFEQEGSTYRAVCDISEDVSQALFALEFDDPEYEQKRKDLIAPLPVREIENLTESIPTQEEAEAYLGKTGQELIDDGWTVSFYNLEDLNFEMNHGAYSYAVTFEGEVKDPENFDEYADMGGLTVAAISCSGVGDATYIEMPEE